jgi:2'-5' RNA ligase
MPNSHSAHAMNTQSWQRVFVGIKVSDQIAKACMRTQAELAGMPVRCIPKNDLHLTLVPPWQMADQPIVEEKLRKAVEKTRQFKLTLDRFSLYPNAGRPRLAWITCFPSQALLALKKSLQLEFERDEHEKFIPHITLARFSNTKIRSLFPRPIDQAVNLSMSVQSVELFASPSQNGHGYAVLASVPLLSM